MKSNKNYQFLKKIFNGSLVKKSIFFDTKPTIAILTPEINKLWFLRERIAHSKDEKALLNCIEEFDDFVIENAVKIFLLLILRIFINMFIT